MGEYKIGDRVRRASSPSADLNVGDIGLLLWHNSESSGAWQVRNQRNGQTQFWHPEYFEPFEAGTAAAPPAAPTGQYTCHTCGVVTGCESCHVSHGCGNRALRGELGDLRGERDSLRSQVARLERALDDAQRRGRR